MKIIRSLKLNSSPPRKSAGSALGRKTKGSSQVSILVLVASAIIFLAGLVYFMKSRDAQGAENTAPVTPAPKPFPPRAQNEKKNTFHKSTIQVFSPDDWAFNGISPKVTVRKDGPFPVIESVWGQKDVFIIHPISPREHGTVDFSSITQNAQGALAITIRDHPKGDCWIEVLNGEGSPTHAMILNKDDWETLNIPFANEPVTLNIHANGWACEHAFLTYEFKN